MLTGIDAHEQVDMIERGEADISLDYLPDDLIEALERHASDQLMRSQYPAVVALALNAATSIRLTASTPDGRSPMRLTGPS